MAKTKTKKKEEVIDLKPKAEKISEEQLKTLQNLVSNMNKIKFDLGTMEVQKYNMIHTLTTANDNIIAMQNKFKEEYGTFDINIQDGTINYRDEQTDKKD